MKRVLIALFACGLLAAPSLLQAEETKTKVEKKKSTDTNPLTGSQTTKTEETTETKDTKNTKKSKKVEKKDGTVETTTETKSEPKK
jgi:hypothetical protein